MKYIPVLMSVLLLSACASDGLMTGISNITGTGSNSSQTAFASENTATRSLGRVITINELTPQAAFQNGYDLVKVAGLVRSDAQRTVMESYIEGLQTRLKELEVRRKSIMEQNKYNTSGSAVRNVGGGGGFFSELGKVLDTMDAGNKLVGNSELKIVEKEIHTAKRLLLESKAMLQ